MSSSMSRKTLCKAVTPLPRRARAYHNYPSPHTFPTLSALPAYYEGPPQVSRPTPRYAPQPYSSSNQGSGGGGSTNASPQLALMQRNSFSQNSSTTQSGQQPFLPLMPFLAPHLNPTPVPETVEEYALHSPRKFTLSASAFGIPKTRRRSDTTGAQFLQGSSKDGQARVDGLDLAVQVGEDAYFIRENAMGVADGVGGWARSRKHPSDAYTPSARISRGLMHFCSSAFSSSSYPQYLSPPPPHPPDFVLPTAESVPLWDSSNHRRPVTHQDDPIQVLHTAYLQTMSHIGSPCATNYPPNPYPTPPPSPDLGLDSSNGSSTATILVLSASTAQTPSEADPESSISEEDGLRVQVAHLGDCALYQFRPGVGLVFRSEEMVHSFNHPVQLGPHSKTTPLNDARPYSIPVRRHDVLVLASDGVSDNLWDWEVGEVIGRLVRLPTLPPTASAPGLAHGLPLETSQVGEETKWHALPRLLSEAIARRAYERSKSATDSDPDTPFSMRARIAGVTFSGGKGKCDDISVVVGVVSGV